jgi:AraC-like DNA-binding protein
VAVPRERQLVRARDLADTGYTETLTVDDLAAAAHMSKAHFSREFRRAFGETPYAYLLSRRLERAATLLRGTDYTVADICMRVGLTSVGSFTTSFTRAYGVTPTQYRASFPSAASLARIPLCVLKAYGRPSNSTIGEDGV